MKKMRSSWAWMELIFGPMKSPCVDTGRRSFGFGSENGCLIPFLLENSESYMGKARSYSKFKKNGLPWKTPRTETRQPVVMLTSSQWGEKI